MFQIWPDCGKKYLKASMERMKQNVFHKNVRA